MLSKALSASVYRIDAFLVEVEVDVGSADMNQFNVVGLPHNAGRKAVSESRRHWWRGAASGRSFAGTHNRVLFLDELPEFQRNVLEVMRQPLEDGSVTIARAAVSVPFPSRFMLAAAMNPYRCGYFGDPTRECHCTSPMIQRYVSKISGPLLYRIDIQIEVPPVKYKERNCSYLWWRKTQRPFVNG